jgi:hypothetical protein
MFRKSLAILLVFSWIVLSGLDLLEDFDVQLDAGVHSPLEGPLPNGGSGINVVNNIVEFADRPQPFHAGLFGLLAVHLSVGTDLSFKKTSRLHKLHRVFLI